MVWELIEKKKKEFMEGVYLDELGEEKWVDKIKNDLAANFMNKSEFDIVKRTMSIRSAYLQSSN